MSAPQISGLFQQPGKGFYKPPAAPAPTAPRGWGDQGGNTFLAGMARMSGSTPSAPAAPRSPRAMNSPGEHGMGAKFFSLLRNRNPAPATAKTPGLGVPMLGSSLSARDKLNRIFGGDR